MKMTQAKDFQPITIIIETLHEAQVLKALVGNVTGSGPARDITDNFWVRLADCGIDSADHTKPVNLFGLSQGVLFHCDNI